jgi:chitodextrinase
VWHHLAVVLDKSQNAANEVNVYVDGVLQTAQAQAYSSANTNNFGTNPLYLMARGGSQEFSAGVIDDFRVYNRALSASEIQQLYTLGTAPDTQAPTVPTNLSATAVSVSQINLTWAAATDNVGVTGYRVFRNASQIGTATNTSFSDTGLAASTTYTYAVAAFDAAGNPSAQSASVSATTPAPLPPDTIPPTISIIAPANGAVVAGTVSVSASAADNVGVAGVQFMVDGTNLGAEVVTAPYQVSWNTTSISNGSHTVTARARDAAGNTATATATALVSNTVPTGGLVCDWAMDDGTGTTAADSSGSGNPGTLVNGPAWTTGKINGALSFNGINNYVSTPGINLSGTRAVSVCLWVNRTYSKTGGHALFESTANFNNSTTGFGVFPDDTSTCSGGGMLVGLQGNAGYNLKCFAQPSSGVWHHLAVVLDKSQNAANEVNVYVDGVLQTAQAQAYSSANTNNFGTNPLYLMARGGSQEFSAGVIDDFRVYNRALSASEIQQLYTLGTAPMFIANDAPAVTQVPVTVNYKSSDNKVQFRFQGTPGHSYEIQWCPTLLGTWKPLVTMNADASGQVVYEGPTPGETAFFRVVLP